MTRYLQACLVGVAVPDPDVFPKWIKDKLGEDAVKGKGITELCSAPVSKTENQINFASIFCSHNRSRNQGF